MRQTIVKDGIQLRLQDLLGSENSLSPQYSVQDNMIENVSRVCKAIVGNSTNGKVMSGMTINASNGDVSSGYAITKSGKVIKFGNERRGVFPTVTNSTRVNVYAVYAQAIRGSENNPPASFKQGGFSVNTIRSYNGPKTDIIKDQIGASTEIDNQDGQTTCVVYNVGAVNVPDDNHVYVGTIIIGANGERSIIYPEIAKSDVQYIYNTGTCSNTLWATNVSSPDPFTSHIAELMIDGGSNNLRKIRFTLRTKMTTTQRVANTDYNMQISFLQYDSLHSLMETSPVIYSVPDAAAPKSFEIDVNQKLRSDCQFLGLRAYISKTSATIFTDSTGYADVQYIIEKLN